MTRHLDVTPKPEAPAPKPLVAVDRAITELRRGAPVLVRSPVGRVLMLAAEAVGDETLARLKADAGSEPMLALTGRRAGVLGLTESETGVFRVAALDGFDTETIAFLVDPCAASLGSPDLNRLQVAAASGLEPACVALTKLARLLPAAVMAEATSHAPFDVVQVEADDITAYQVTAAQTLRQVSEARVPLENAENARIVAFRPSDGGIEHLAIIIGEPDPDQAILTRLHSECFTGDLLGSLRCDCGDQLRGAIAEIAQRGSGVLLYLAQEGRGIGLVNKLRAYQLQDEGFDTLDANLQLGFDDDERIYLPAAQMLRLLGIGRVRLLTNNPGKVESLARHGIEVAERVPHVFPSNDHNQGYLRTKATRGGHLF
ncbi:GTP cyclohydrolase II [Paramagnetospirillum kuznetsovii]|uniref:GTP cyclohydrolase-2 n=1 Tax=Paramagnetospirillum kuznetsovii TaxID=2053833 RepID=A0A364P354_9PROT|nr:GTP cyclohydrolase II [Paramagnetospirillum kuznetsovii]RAU23744.1 GTP cyclohydrolase II [Paramagnetospirillum kuznetsovii]